MKKLILIPIFVLAYVFSVHASVLEVSSIEEITDAVSNSKYPNLKFSQCDEWETYALGESTEYLKKNITNLQKEVEAYSTDKLNKQEKKFLKKVKKTLACAQKKVSQKLTYSCKKTKTCKTAEMYVIRLFMVPGALQKNTIHSCMDPDNYFYTLDSVSGVILHEATHLCGTNDIEYLLEHAEVNEEPLLRYSEKYIRKDDGIYSRKRLFSKNGANNADSYRYWYHNGFCMPGRDC